MFNWLAKQWRKIQRRMDMQMLWPACVEHADSLDQAKAAFYWHVSQDSAWSDYDEKSLIEFVDQLKPEQRA